MPVVLTHSKSVFLHMPKTGGTWVRFALERAGIPWQDFLMDKEEPTEYRIHEHATFDECQDTYSDYDWFTIVRNPFTWYPAFWAQLEMHGWGGGFVIGHDCFNSYHDFPLFLEFVIVKHPGFLSEYYAKYTKPCVTVLRNEFIASDLAAFLVAKEEKFDDELLRTTPITNPGASLPQFVGQITYTPELASKLVAAEREIFTKYNYPKEPDKRV